MFHNLFLESKYTLIGQSIWIKMVNKKNASKSYWNIQMYISQNGKVSQFYTSIGKVETNLASRHLEPSNQETTIQI